MSMLTNESKDPKDRERMRKSLDEIVAKLDQAHGSSDAWKGSIDSHKEEWERLKSDISEKQRALKLLVTEKKAGRVGTAEFEDKYKKLQDDLTDLEFKVYNLRLGTSIER